MSPRLNSGGATVDLFAQEVDRILDECGSRLDDQGSLKQTAVKDMEASMGALFKKLGDEESPPATPTQQ